MFGAPADCRLAGSVRRRARTWLGAATACAGAGIRQRRGARHLAFLHLQSARGRSPAHPCRSARDARAVGPQVARQRHRYLVGGGACAAPAAMILSSRMSSSRATRLCPARSRSQTNLLYHPRLIMVNSASPPRPRPSAWRAALSPPFVAWRRHRLHHVANAAARARPGADAPGRGRGHRERGTRLHHGRGGRRHGGGGPRRRGSEPRDRPGALA